MGFLRGGPSISMAEPQSSVHVAPPAPPVTQSAWSPLREPLFRTLWAASVVSYIGTWMQNMGTGWLMASLTASPMMVGLVQAATTLPVFLVILPAGALADMVDRRRFLLWSQAWMVVAAAALGILTVFGMVSPWSLVLLTFALGFGAVMNDPAWQAITPETVSGQRLASAVALNSAGYNAARAVGPALGGLVIAAAGSGFAFLLNAASFFGVIIFLYRWKRVPHHVPEPATRLRHALAAGFRYARGAPTVRAVLVRTGVFSLFASVIWALLPLVARPHGPVGYGLLLGFFGLGALAGAVLLPGTAACIFLRHAGGDGHGAVRRRDLRGGAARGLWLAVRRAVSGRHVLDRHHRDVERHRAGHVPGVDPRADALHVPAGAAGRHGCRQRAVGRGRVTPGPASGIPAGGSGDGAGTGGGAALSPAGAREGDGIDSRLGRARLQPCRMQSKTDAALAAAVRDEFPSAAKAVVQLRRLLARLKACPSQECP